MNTTIENIPSLPIAYIRRTGAYGEGNIVTMEQLKQWANANHLMDANTIIFGIIHDNMQTTPPENCRYDAGIVLTGKKPAQDDGISYGKIIKGNYAVFTVTHTFEAMDNAWANLFPALSALHCRLDSTRPILERYAARHLTQNLCEICVPIED